MLIAFCLHIDFQPLNPSREEVWRVAFAYFISVFHASGDTVCNVWRAESHLFYATASIISPQPYGGISDLAGCLSTPNRLCMASKDDTFNIRPERLRHLGAARAHGGRVGRFRPRPNSFAAKVQQAIRRPAAIPIGSVGPERPAADSMREVKVRQQR
jgi:hypothetical protein